MRIRRTLTLLAGSLFAYAGWLGCSAPLPPPAPGSAPADASAPKAAPVAAPPPPERSQCRPEIRGQHAALAQTEAALGEFFDRVLAGDDWRVATEWGPPDPSLFVAKVRRLRACPRVYEVTSQRTPELSDGLLIFDEPELGAVRAGFVVRDGGRIVLHLYTVEKSFRAGLARAELEPFLAESPEWIPSGGTAACRGSKPDEEKTFALFRGARTNVLCVVRGDASRCFELAASLGGWLYLEVMDGERCGIGTNAVVGPDLGLQIVPYRQRQWVPREPIGHVGSAPQNGTMEHRPLPRAWTDLPSRWNEVDAGRFPIRAVVNGIWEESREDIGPEAPPTISGSDLLCLRLDGVWRCSARNEDWPPLGPIRTRSGAGGTIASIVSTLHEPDAGILENSRFLFFARGEGGRLVDLARFPIGEEDTHISDESEADHTQLVQSWDFTHDQPLCIHVTRARARLSRSRKVGERFENHESDVAVVYGPAPASIPRRAPRMAPPDPFHPSQPVQDLRGSWQLEGESWRRVASCTAS